MILAARNTIFVPRDTNLVPGHARTMLMDAFEQSGPIFDLRRLAQNSRHSETRSATHIAAFRIVSSSALPDYAKQYEDSSETLQRRDHIDLRASQFYMIHAAANATTSARLVPYKHAVTLLGSF